VETDPDDLGADDRRYFVFGVRPPVRIARTGPASFFLDQGLDVLAEGGRARLTTPDSAEVILAIAGEGASLRRGRVLVIVPPDDPTLLPALDRRLAEAGIPWSYETPGERGETALGENRLPVDLRGLAILRHYGLVPVNGALPTAEVPARLGTGEPFLVAGRDDQGTYLLLAAPLDPAWTTLPLEAGMVPFLEWMASRAEGAGPGGRSIQVGEPISLGANATHVETPDGTRHPVDAAQSFRRTRDAGLYAVLRADTVIERVAANPPPSESILRRATPRELDERLGTGVIRADDLGSWQRAIFTDRQGPELWRALLLLALLLLAVESWIAAAGGTGARTPPHPVDPSVREAEADVVRLA
jgi:hypothetical protein